MLADLLYGRQTANLSEIDYIVIDSHYRPMRYQIPRLPYYIIKSHENYNSSYKRVIHVLRHPADVFVSYYRYYSNGGNVGSQEEFAADWVNGRIWPGSWSNHVLSWLGPQGYLSRPQILQVKYEDIVADTGSQLERIAAFVGVSAERSRIDRICDDCSLDKMKIREDRGNRPSERASKYRFVGQGISGGWRSSADAAAIDIIRQYDGEIASHFGYSF